MKPGLSVPWNWCTIEHLSITRDGLAEGIIRITCKLESCSDVRCSQSLPPAYDDSSLTSRTYCLHDQESFRFNGYHLPTPSILPNSQAGLRQSLCGYAGRSPCTII